MNKKNYFHRVTELTSTRFWINNVTKDEAHWAIREGAVGCTQNPSYTWKMMQNPEMKQEIDALIQQYADLPTNEIVVRIQRDLVAQIAEIFKPLYLASGKKQGYVSIQGDPFREDTQTIVQYGLFNREVSENIMIKIPVTEDGLKAIAELASKGIAINATEVMTVRQALDVCEVYKQATKNLENKAPIYFSHISGILDEYLQKLVEKEGIDVHKDYLWQAGIAAAKKTYWMCKQANPEVGFIGGGARGLQHFTEMVGADASITINWKNTADRLLEENPPVVERFFLETPHAVIDELVEKIPDFRKSYFVHAIEPEEYEEFGPVVLFRTSFENAWKNAENYVNQQLGRE
ncbi:MAG: hypothetical protein IJ356_04465 [Erysipelotrichaceae bacterium]|nr:hypothetical protein [Erysipelotrichaceae bacterium]